MPRLMLKGPLQNGLALFEGCRRRKHADLDADEQANGLQVLLTTEGAADHSRASPSGKVISENEDQSLTHPPEDHKGCIASKEVIFSENGLSYIDPEVLFVEPDNEPIVVDIAAGMDTPLSTLQHHPLVDPTALVPVCQPLMVTPVAQTPLTPVSQRSRDEIDQLPRDKRISIL